MEPKTISKTNAILQIIGIFFAIAIINGLIGQVVNGNSSGDGAVMELIGLFVWLYLSYIVWLHTNPERLKKWQEKPWWRR